MEVIIDCKEDFIEEAKYIFDTLSVYLGLPFAYVKNKSSETTMLIYYGNEIKKQKEASLSIPFAPFKQSELKTKWIEDVPILSGDGREPSYLFISEGGRITMGFDIVSASFNLLSLQEEYLDSRRDEWGCFAAYFSNKDKLGIMEYPAINSYFMLIKHCIREIGKKRGIEFDFAPLWPQEKDCAICFTHDVDKVYKWNFAKRIMRKFLNKENDPYWNFDDWLDLEGQYAVKSAFYFCSASGNRRYDPKYNIQAPVFRKVFKDLDNAGHEIGLHPSYNNFNDVSKISSEKNRLDKLLEKKTRGMRQHYLRFAQAESWTAQAEVGFLYDTTLGYNERIGFRAGIALPFLPFDPVKKRIIPVVELPLVISDGALFEHMNYSAKDALDACVKIIDKALQLNGLIVILWHEISINKNEFSDRFFVYKGILDYVSSKNAWIARPTDIAKWWNKRYVRYCRGI